MPDELLEGRDVLATRVEAWKQQWKQEGRQEGEAAVLLRLLERRFGELPEWARERVSAADMATLERLGLRVLDAGTLDEVFA